MSDVIIAAFIGAAGTIIGVLATHLLENRKKKKVENSINEKKEILSFAEFSGDLNRLMGKMRTLQMYTVNSYVLCNQINMFLQQNPDVTLEKIEIMVRKKDDESESDLRRLDDIINNWQSLVENKRIKKLTIIGYDHDPDHHYTLIGDEAVFFGQVIFDDSKPTGTDVDYRPIIIRNDTEAGRTIIKNYQKHFDNVVERYKDRLTLYTTESV